VHNLYCPEQEVGQNLLLHRARQKALGLFDESAVIRLLHKAQKRALLGYGESVGTLLLLKAQKKALHD
jgi:hypothetical protein